MRRVSFLVIVICYLIVSGCFHMPVPPSGPVPVNLLTVAQHNVYYYDKYPANTVAINQVDLRPQVQGYITGIKFIEGSHVHKGQVLYEIDKQLYQEAYDQAKANLEVEEGNLKQAQQDNDRYTYLNTQDAVATQTLDHAVIALRNARNSVKAAEQSLKMAATNLSFAVITAPFDGTVGFSQVKLGNLVTIGQTILNTISSDNPMGVDFFISEKQLYHFEDLKKQESNLDSLFTIILPNDSLYPYLGKLSIIDRAADPQAGTVHIRAEFPNPHYFLKPGISCVLRVHNQEKGPQIVIPNKAVLELMGEYFVYLVKDTVVPNKEDSTKTHPVLMSIQKKVQLGQIVAPNVIITKGIQPGDRLVVDGIQSLHTGSIVTVAKKSVHSK